MKTLFHNGLIKTMEPAACSSRNYDEPGEKSKLSGNRLPTALLVENSKIRDIGETRQLLEEHTDGKTLRIDLKGRMLLPGFIDNHTHFFEYLKTERGVELKNAASLKDIKDLIETHLLKTSSASAAAANINAGMEADNPPARKLNETEWIYCYNLEKHKIKDYGDLDIRFLDSISPDFPLVIQSKDYHTRCCNSAALNLIGIDRMTPDPAGGKIGRFSNGEPDGFLFEKAWTLLTDYLKKNIAPHSVKTNITSALPAALKKIYRYGITGLHCMENYNNYQAFRDIFDHKLRVCWHIYDEDIEEVIADKLISYSGSDFRRFGTIKTFLDGSLGSSTALLSTAIDGNNSTSASLLLEENELRELILKCKNNGLGLSVHSIGDLSTKIFLNLIDELYPKGEKVSPLIRLEHLQFIDAHDRCRIKERGIYCSLQPYHISFDITLIESLPSSLRDIAYPLAELFSLNCLTGFGSDAPIAEINPFWGIYCALTRKADLDPLRDSWTPHQRLTTEQALHGYTYGAALGSLSHKTLGSLTIGKAADLIVIDDYRQQPPEYWLEAKSYLTMINGRIVYNELAF
jgi:hypothetical protein